MNICIISYKYLYIGNKYIILVNFEYDEIDLKFRIFWNFIHQFLMAIIIFIVSEHLIKQINQKSQKRQKKFDFFRTTARTAMRVHSADCNFTLITLLFCMGGN